ncbi:hypothetical protein [Lacticaseibacillus paracasei]|uniref:hypothetical protein n=1 Tax=Lacticaseibacillus paracasei TaxID=1597 RepID=UPI003DA9A81A
MVIIRKMDEMERHFADQSIKNAYLFMVVSLFIYTIFKQFQTGKWDFVFLILIVQNLILIGSDQWLKHRADRSDKGPAHVLYMTIVFTAILLAIGAIGLMFHGK